MTGLRSKDCGLVFVVMVCQVACVITSKMQQVREKGADENGSKGKIG